MEKIFIKKNNIGINVEFIKDNENPTNSKIVFSLWWNDEKIKPNFKQRWKYFWTGRNNINDNNIIMDVNNVSELTKFLTSNIDKINLDIKKFNSSSEMIKRMIKKTEDNVETILKKKIEKPVKKQGETQINCDMNIPTDIIY